MRTILITGASRGIGRAIAMRFACDEECRLILNSKTGGEKLREAADEIRAMGRECITIAGDVSDPSFIRRMINEVHEAGYRVDVLVNNAGISYVGLVQDMSVEDFRRVIDTNLCAVHYLTAAVISDMIAQKNGRIINISSVWGNIGASCEVVYSASKGGVNSYTKALARELAPSGIAVNAVACGAIDTDMNKCFSKEELEELAEEIPVGRLGTPEEVAELVYGIAGQSPYLTGQIITMDGGWT